MKKKLFVFSFLLFLSACATKIVSSNKTIEQYSHQVKYKGESLALIARWYTGDSKNWQQLAEINNLAHPEKIEIGQVLIIPYGMLARFEPLPKSIIENNKVNSNTNISNLKTVEGMALKSATLKRNPKRAMLSRASQVNNRLIVDIEEKLKKLEIEKSLVKLNQ